MNSIKRRLVLALFGSLATLLVGGSLAVYVFTRTILLRDFDAMVRAAERDTLSILMQAVLEGAGEGGEILLEMRRDPPVYIRAWTKEGKALARSAFPHPPEFQFVPATEDRLLASVELPLGRSGRGWIAPRPLFAVRDRPPMESGSVKHVRPGGGGPAPGSQGRPEEIILMIAADTGEVTLALRRLQMVLVTVGVVMIAVVIAIANVVTSRGLAPVRQLADQASRIDAKTLDARFPTQGVPLELLPISQGLNELLARLQRGFERERRFTADVAHELRTPIAELRSLSEVALKWPEADPATMASFRDTLDISLQMQGIVNGLLAIARCEAGTQVVARETVEAAGLVRKTWEQHQQNAAQKHIACTLDLPETCSIATDPGMLQVIVGNLLANAAEYTPPNGMIRVNLSGNGGGFDFRVTNSVTNLNQEDLAHLKERFWRKDAARSSSEHSGIGLSVSDAFAQALGMRLEPALGPDGALEMRLCGQAPKSPPATGPAI